MNGQVDSRSAWAARLEVVAELASLINTTFDLDEIFRTAILKLQRVLQYRRASVVLVSDDRQSYYLHTLYDVAQGGFVDERATYPIDQGLTGQAIRTGEAIRVDTFAGTSGIRTSGERNVSALIVPLHVGEEVIGTLNFGALESESYNDEDLELAVLLGRQIATSLYYSRLLATIDHQREALAIQHAHVESERAQLAALIDASDAGVMMVSGDRVALVNRAMGELLGLPQEVVEGAPLEDINRVLARSLRDPAQLEAQVAAIKSGSPSLRDRVEFQFPHHQVCQRTVATVRGKDDEVIGQLVIFRDVTKEAEAEAAKSEFVSIVSHELRTPLTSIKTSLNLLARGAGGAISEGMTDLLEIALRNLDRLIRLVDDLLDLSRIESGRVAMNLTSVTLAEAVQRGVDAVEAFAGDREMRIEVEESDPDLLVSADADRLQQVIVNLISNAVKFSPPGGRVGLSWWRQDAHAVLEISDQGPGIPAHQLETIFDKFRQLEQSATRKYGGAGLGLTISRTIMKELGGTLWAESEEGKGSRFFVKLRLTSRKAEVAEEAAPVEGGLRSVLLVERDADLRRLFRAQFEAEGWEVAVSESGADALSKAEEGGVGVVVVGLELGDMHGLDFLRELRASPASVDVPALLVGPGGEASRAVAYGADGWVDGDADNVLAEAERLVSRPRRRVVLLIEDDPAVRTGLARGLRLAGYACLEAANGEVAVDLAHRRVPDVVLTDVQIPGKDGLEILRGFRADPQLANVPAIVVTGHATPETLKTIHSLNASFLSKPFGVKTVLEEVERLIGTTASPN